MDPVEWYDLVVDKNSGEYIPTFRIPPDYFDRCEGPTSGDHLTVFREWMRTMRAIQNFGNKSHPGFYGICNRHAGQGAPEGVSGI